MLILLSFLFFISISGAEHTSLDWKNCTVKHFPALKNLGIPSEYLSSLDNLATLDCAELEVPVRWGNPEGEKIKLGMARYRTPGPTRKRQGSLIYNPGGPGEAGSVSAIAYALGKPSYTNATVDNYDVIGLDPRGIGLSTPVKCDPDLYNKAASVSIFPSNETEFEDMVKANKAFAESCRDKTGALFFHLDTVSAARDIEAVRIALGEDVLNWIGLSYGTMLGAAYAELYPENVGRMLLDGNVDHSLSETSALHAEVSTYEDTLNQFFDWCISTATETECPPKLHGQNLPKVFDELVLSADKSPIPAPGCAGNSSGCRSVVTGEDIRKNIQGNGFLAFVKVLPDVRNSGWSTLARVLNDTIAGHDATGLSSKLATSETDSSFPGIAIGCLDWYHNATSFEDVKYKEQMSSTIAPHTKGASHTYRYQTACIGWPARVKDPNHALNATAMAILKGKAKAPPILMVNANHDPQSSYIWAEGLRTQIPSAVLLTRNGSGHTSYLLGGEASTVIDNFLANGTLPSPNSVVNS
jgi:pimeloyl-ACP methyl ester carboxylesterase